MSRSLAIAFLGVALIVAGMVSADAAGPQPPKVGTVNLERTLAETSAGKRANEQFKQAQQKKQQEFDQKKKSLQTAVEQFSKQRQLMKPEVARQKEQDLQKRAIELQELGMKLERDLAVEQTKLIQDLLKKAAPVIKDIAQREGFSMVIDASAVVWADKAVDLTDKVNKQLK